MKTSRETFLLTIATARPTMGPMPTATRLDLSAVPASCPFVILDAAGTVAGWCETEDGAARTCAEWGNGHTVLDRGAVAK